MDGLNNPPGNTHETAANESLAQRPMLAGVEVREEDLEPQRGLKLASGVFHVSAVVIFVLAMWQFAAWWSDRPPGGVGIGVLVGDTIRLIVFSGLLWAAGDLARLLIKTHYDVRAGRILLARQTYMMRQWGVAKGALPTADELDPGVDRRGIDPEDTVEPPNESPLG